MKIDFSPVLFREGFGNVQYQIPAAGGAAFITSLTTFGTSGPSTVVAGVLNIPVYTSPTVLAANDGLSLTGSTAKLGQPLGAVGDPAQFTEDRFLPLKAFNLHFTGSGGVVMDNMSDPAIRYNYNVDGVHYMEWAFTASVTNTVPFQRRIENNPNGGFDDNIYIQGWNIDSQFDPANPSWTTRLEYKFVGNFYEYHVQWESAGGARVYRFLSFTFQDHGGVADIQNIFFKTTSIEYRPLSTNQSFASLSNNFDSGIDTTFIVRQNVAASIVVRDVISTTGGNCVTELQTGNVPYIWSAFATYTWIMNSGLHAFNMNEVLSPAPNVGIQLQASTGTEFITIWNTVVSSAGDNASLFFSPASAGGILRASINLDQGAGVLSYNVPAGGYSHRFFVASTLIFGITSSGIFTASPGGSGAGTWLLGTTIAGVFTTNLAAAVEVNINGVLTRLAVLN